MSLILGSSCWGYPIAANKDNPPHKLINYSQTYRYHFRQYRVRAPLFCVRPFKFFDNRGRSLSGWSREMLADPG